MDETNNDRNSIYEIGYLIASSIREEAVPSETDALRKIVTDSGAEVIAEDAPHRQNLAYTMRVKTVSGAYEKYDEAYFGWIKFEVGSDKIEAIKNAFEAHQSVLRVLLTSTIRENTYLGKRAAVVAAELMPKHPVSEESVRPVVVEERKPVTAATIEEMDKSIDEMVKEA